MRFLAFFLLASISTSTFAQTTDFGCKHLKNRIRYATEKSMNNADSVHIAHYNINIDSVSFNSQQLWSRTELTAVSLVDGMNIVRLDLQGHTVDSVILDGGSTTTFLHDGLNLNINIPIINTTDTSKFTVHYHGQPSQDPSGWGGFYWSGTSYAFNLGVGFDEDPHVYGRAWYPCLDVFTDKSTYDFRVTVDSVYLPVCNGEMMSQLDLGDGRKITHWQMDEPIPTYLTAIAIAPFILLEREYSGIPTQFACLASDTNNVNSTFTNMQACVDRFLEAFGPYRFNRIGYSLVPFSGGAMEHATSIHIGKAFIDGSLSYETLWAHELAHMWWGDNVTCSTAEDMWLNEGWAAYSEALFTEEVYGEDAYMNWFRPLHRQMLQFAHIEDGDYYAMNDIPHAVTYGTHVYEKGPLMCHSLRGYMGDSLFFLACHAYQDSLEYGNATSQNMRDIFTSATGLDMSGFFNGWILEPGWAHFSVDSFEVTSIPSAFEVEVHLRQRSRANQHVYEMNVPVTFYDGNGIDTTLWIPMNQETQSSTIQILFEPVLAMIDGDEQLADAMATYTREITDDGLTNFLYTNVKFDVDNPGQGGSFVRVSDNFVAPHPNYSTTGGILLNDYHFWSVEGILGEGFASNATFKYYGTTSTATGYMDNNLFVNSNEDSLIMLYRPGAGYNWQEVDGYELVTGSNVTNGRGEVDVESVKLGEYVLAIYDAALGVRNNRLTANSVYPNPASSAVTINLDPKSLYPATIQILDMTGRTVIREVISRPNASINLEGCESGTHLIRIESSDGKITDQKIEIVR